MLWIKNFVRPEHHDHFVAANVRNVVRPARDRLDDCGLCAIREKFVGFFGYDMSETEPRVSLNHQKLFIFRMVIMPPTRDPRVGREK